MSFTDSNCFEISNSALNNSKAKQLFSFSKAKRFAPPIKSQNIVNAYDLPSNRSRVGTKFGTSPKRDPF